MRFLLTRTNHASASIQEPDVCHRLRSWLLIFDAARMGSLFYASLLPGSIGHLTSRLWCQLPPIYCVCYPVRHLNWRFYVKMGFIQTTSLGRLCFERDWIWRSIAFGCQFFTSSLGMLPDHCSRWHRYSHVRGSSFHFGRAA